MSKLKPVRGAEPVSYKEFLSNVRCVFTLAASLIMQVLLCFLDSILGFHIQTTFHIDEKLVGYVYVIPCLIYTIGCPFISHWFDKAKPDRRYCITIALFICSIALFLTGPSRIFGIPE